MGSTPSLPLTRRQLLSRGVGAALAICGVGGLPGLRMGSTSEPDVGGISGPSDLQLIDDDLPRFIHALKTIERGGDPRSAFARYLNGGSAGLKAYARLYNVDADRFVARLASHPSYYQELGTISSRVRARYPEARQAVANVVALAPHTPLVPVFLFIGVMGHGATPREVAPVGGEESLGILIPVELVGVSEETDTNEFLAGATPGTTAELPWLICHEMAHISQIRLQGLERYRRIYRDSSWGTHLAYAIREGAADMVAIRAANRLRSRHSYVQEHEAELSAEFRELADRPIGEPGGWFSGQPGGDSLGRPPGVGYAVGWRICDYYYSRAVDKAQALLAILSASEPEDFDRIAAPYFARG